MHEQRNRGRTDTQTRKRDEHDRQLDARGRRRSPATLPGAGKGREPVSKGKKYPPTLLKPEDVASLLKHVEPAVDRELREDEYLAACRRRALIVFLWRTGCRISEALSVREDDLDRSNQSIFIRHAKGGKQRFVLMDPWGWDELDAWLTIRRAMPTGELFCVLDGPTAGRGIHSSDVRKSLHHCAERAQIRKRVHPHSFRHTATCEWWLEGVDIVTIAQQLGHARTDITLHYLRTLGILDLLQSIGKRRAPVMPIPHASDRNQATRRDGFRV